MEKEKNKGIIREKKSRVSEKLALDALKRFGCLLVHLLEEAEVGHADDVVAADLGGVGPQLLVGEIHVAQRLEDAVEVDLALAHRGVLVYGDIGAAAAIEPGRIEDVPAVLGLIPSVGQQHVGQLVTRILEHVAHVALALVVEEAVGCRR